MVKLLIIADDFTGALDTGIQFAKKGIETQVFRNRTGSGACFDENTGSGDRLGDETHVCGSGLYRG